MASNKRFTDKARDAIVAGQQLTSDLRLAQYEPETLLHALADQADGIVPQVFQRLGVNPADIVRETRALVDRAPKLQYSSDAVVSSGLRQALQSAETEAQSFG